MMISVVIPTLNDAQRLTATLAALAPAAIDGFVREVIVADGGSTDETLAVAEDAGADVVTTGLADALAAARQPWVLLLAAGSRPQVGWEQAAHAHMRDYPDKAGWFTLALPEPGIMGRLGEVTASVRQGIVGVPRAEQGLLMAARHIGQLRSVDDYEAVVRRLGRFQMRPIVARALMMR